MYKDWYEEYLRVKQRKPYRFYEEEFIIYKGFKIERVGEDYTILDVRKSDLYSTPSKRDLNKLKKHGFVKGADLIMLSRDERRCKYHKKAMEKLYQSRRGYEQELKTGTNREAFVKKKIRNINKNIHNHADEFFFFNTRREQIKTKYKLN